MREYVASFAIRFLVFAGVMLGASIVVRADMNEVLNAIRESQFRFAREGSQVPFVATGWAQARFYPTTDFKDVAGAFSEQSYSEGLLYPAYVGRRDMLMLGESATFDRVNLKGGDFADLSVVTLTPVGAWLRQFNQKNLAGVFVAPMFSRQTSQSGDWGTNVFAGVLAMHWSSETFQWVYGGVYEYSFGKNYLYPYGGLIWAPAPKWSVAIVFPWPTVAYSPNDRWLLNVGAAPGGSAFVREADGVRTTYSFYTWTVSVGAGWRFYKKLWLYGSAGLSGLRSFEALRDGGGDDKIKTKPGTVFTVSIQFRP